MLLIFGGFGHDDDDDHEHDNLTGVNSTPVNCGEDKTTQQTCISYLQAKQQIHIIAPHPEGVRGCSNSKLRRVNPARASCTLQFTGKSPATFNLSA